MKRPDYLTVLLPLAIVGIGFLNWWITKPRPTPWLDYEWEAWVTRLDNGPPLENLVMMFPPTMVEGRRSGNVRGKGTWILYRLEGENLVFLASEDRYENLPPRTTPPFIKGGASLKTPYGPRILLFMNEFHPGEVLYLRVPFEGVESEKASLREKEGARVIFTKLEDNQLDFEARFSVLLTLWRGSGENRVLRENFWAENVTRHVLWLHPC